MKVSRAIDKYLAQYSLRPGALSELHRHWQHVMVVPSYDESPEFLATWQQIYQNTSLLIVLVLNRPDGSDHAVNEPVRAALETYPTVTLGEGYFLSHLNDSCSLLSVDLDRLEGSTPANEGVGRARRVGCDLALELQHQGVIETHWIYSGDVDSIWPADLFTTSWSDEASAVVVPFVHRFEEHLTHLSPDQERIATATELYELKLHHYVLQLRALDSPYGFHALGSSCLFNSGAYASVRGMPLRSAAEDFYLLNKLAKVAPVFCATGHGVTIAPRLSARVPFGTGPAVGKLLAVENVFHEPLFYDARCFDVLGRLCSKFSIWTETQEPNTLEQLVSEFGPAVAADLHELLNQWDYLKAIAHIHRAGSTTVERKNHITTWLDGFRILKIIHLLRDRHYPNLSCLESLNDPSQWPVTHDGTPAGLLRAVHRHLGWFTLSAE